MKIEYLTFVKEFINTHRTLCLGFFFLLINKDIGVAILLLDFGYELGRASNTSSIEASYSQGYNDGQTFTATDALIQELEVRGYSLIPNEEMTSGEEEF